MRVGWVAGVVAALVACGSGSVDRGNGLPDAGVGAGGPDAGAGPDAGSVPPSPAEVRVSVAPAGTGHGRVTSTPAGIDCPGSCVATVAAGTMVTITAKADDGSTFVGWGGACSGPGLCNVAAQTDATVWVDFEPTTPPPPPMSCEGLTPSAPATPITVAIDHYNHCESGLGDAAGTIALRNRYGDTGGSTRQRNLYFIDEASGTQRSFVGNLGSPGSDDAYLAQAEGFVDVMYAPEVVHLVRYDGHGSKMAETSSMPGGRPVAMARFGGKGVLLAGSFNPRSDDATAPVPQQICSFGDDLQPAWCRDLPDAPVIGMAADAKNRALVIVAGATAGTADALWFDADGTAMTDRFTLVTDFQAGAATWLEAAPLIGGDLAIRRVDQRTDAIDGFAFDHRTSQWLAVVKSGATSVTAPPQWLKSRADTALAIVRAGKAYALLPLGAPEADCAQKIDLFAPDGTPCGSFDAGLGSGKCRTADLAVGPDGTPIQVLPKTDPTAYTCSWRWWPGALH